MSFAFAKELRQQQNLWSTGQSHERDTFRSGIQMLFSLDPFCQYSTQLKLLLMRVADIKTIHSLVDRSVTLYQAAMNSSMIVRNHS